MPRGRYGSTPARTAHLRSIAPQGGQAAAAQRIKRARERLERLIGACQTKWEVWPIAFRMGYKAGYARGRLTAER